MMWKSEDNQGRDHLPRSPGRRRTPSRERDSSQQRFGSIERSVAGCGRRVSSGSIERSPGRRSETLIGSGVDNGVSRPDKLVSVPAFVTSSIGAEIEQNNVKKIVAERDVRSPRSQSPAQIRQPNTLSHSNSRKTDQSPYRRNPLPEIDNNHSSQPLRKVCPNHRGLEEGVNRSLSIKRGVATGVTKVETKMVQPKASQGDNLRPKLNRTKSLSRSWDIDEISQGPNQNGSSYASILLEDIQTFHQKSSIGNVTFSLPQCVSKACSIMDAVADLNSNTSS